jgi:hypothetical protein
MLHSHLHPEDVPCCGDKGEQGNKFMFLQRDYEISSN